jgi:hypothetical protein
MLFATKTDLNTMKGRADEAFVSKNISIAKWIKIMFIHNYFIF